MSHLTKWLAGRRTLISAPSSKIHEHVSTWAYGIAARRASIIANLKYSKINCSVLNSKPLPAVSPIFLEKVSRNDYSNLSLLLGAPSYIDFAIYAAF